MGDLIDRQVAIDAVLGIGYTAKLNDGDEVVRMSAVNYVLRNLPSAEPEIIRCKECKLFGDPKCLMCFDGYDWAEPDGYCHMAERREV